MVITHNHHLEINHIIFLLVCDCEWSGDYQTILTVGIRAKLRHYYGYGCTPITSLIYYCVIYQRSKLNFF